jgi:hypothetical protein
MTTPSSSPYRSPPGANEKDENEEIVAFVADLQRPPRRYVFWRALDVLLLLPLAWILIGDGKGWHDGGWRLAFCYLIYRLSVLLLRVVPLSPRARRWFAERRIRMLPRG